MIGTPREAKNPGETVRNRARGSSSPFAFAYPSAENCAVEEAFVPPGHGRADRDPLHAGHLTHAPDDLSVEAGDLLRFARVGHDRHVQRQDVACLEARMRPLQTEQRRQQHAGAGEQDERGGNLRDREEPEAPLVADVIRTLPLDRPNPFAAPADGSRGTNARRMAAVTARTTPTHSRLASTVTSSARIEKRAA